MKYLFLVSAIAIGVYAVMVKPDKRATLFHYFKTQNVNLGLASAINIMTDVEIDFLYQVVKLYFNNTDNNELPASVIDSMHNLELKYHFSFS